MRRIARSTRADSTLIGTLPSAMDTPLRNTPTHSSGTEPVRGADAHEHVGQREGDRGRDDRGAAPPALHDDPRDRDGEQRADRADEQHAAEGRGRQIERVADRGAAGRASSRTRSPADRTGRAAAGEPARPPAPEGRPGSRPIDACGGGRRARGRGRRGRARSRCCSERSYGGVAWADAVGRACAVRCLVVSNRFDGGSQARSNRFEGCGSFCGYADRCVNRRAPAPAAPSSAPPHRPPAAVGTCPRRRPEVPAVVPPDPRRRRFSGWRLGLHGLARVLRSGPHRVSHP